MLGWLKKDLSKDLAFVRGLGAGMLQGHGFDLIERGRAAAVAAAPVTAGVLLGILVDVLNADPKDDLKRRRGVSVLDGRDPYTREWNAADQYGTGPW